MIIAIPTYNRPELKSYELACAIAGEENVYVFFHNKIDRAKYTKPIKNAIISNIERGIANNRNAILNYFKQGEIIMMDDEITKIYKLYNGKLKTLSIEEIRQEFNRCFEICRKNNCKLWGVYPVSNEYFMSNKIANKALIIGWIMGITISELRFDNLPTKEDYDFALQNMKVYKKVARFNYLTCNSKFKSKGGLDYVYGTEKEIQACSILLNKWKQWLKLNPKRLNEVLLK